MRDAGDVFGRAPVREQVIVAPGGVEARHEFPRRHDGGAGGADHLQHPGRDAIEVWHRITRRVLHSDALAANDLLQVCLERTPRRVALTSPAARPAPPGPLFDVVRDGDRGADARDEDEDPPREVHVLEAEEVAGDRVGPAKVVQEPAVEPCVRDRALNVGQRLGAEAGHGYSCCAEVGFHSARQAHVPSPRVAQRTCSTAPTLLTRRRNSSLRLAS